METIENNEVVVETEVSEELSELVEQVIAEDGEVNWATLCLKILALGVGTAIVIIGGKRYIVHRKEVKAGTKEPLHKAAYHKVVNLFKRKLKSKDKGISIKKY